ncbi:MAG: cobalt ECF transporter T component CbiQ [Dehalococcoidia bacterium]
MTDGGFLARNIAGFTKTLESVLVTENLSRIPGIMQGMDPRVKVATVLLYIILVGLAQDFPLLIVIFILALILVVLSKIPVALYFSRLFIFIPIFTAVIAVPALFITPGVPLVYVAGKSIITVQGARTAGLLMMRVIDSLSLGLLLILTTPWTKFLQALRWLRLPSLIVDILGMTYRYIFLLLHTANSMFLARKSRTIGGFSSAENRRWLGRALATTMVKSQHLSEEVYLAMLSRGYRGEIRTLNELSLRGRDFAWMAFALVTISSMLWSIYR